MQKRLLAILLALSMVLTLAPTAWMKETTAQEGATVCAETTIDPGAEEQPDNDGLFAGYVEKVLYGDLIEDSSPFRAPAANRLTGVNASLYKKLKAFVSTIAEEGGDTTITFTPGDLGIAKKTFTRSELDMDCPLLITGSDGKTTFAEGVIEAICLRMFDASAIFNALLADCPYELYWFDQSNGWQNGIQGSSSNNSITVTQISFTLYVSPDYAETNADHTYNPERMDSSIPEKVAAAKTKANSIVEKYAGKSDFEILDGYRQEICGMVDYNTEASQPDLPYYGDPWQLIDVFDGGPETTVACEGYARAFQYLCDLTEFDGDVACCTVTGIMDSTGDSAAGAGRHMWNIVTLDGANYLADITNCDEGCVGSPDLLFLAGSDGGDTNSINYEETEYDPDYSFDGISGNRVHYRYDEEMANLCDGEVLELSAAKYEAPATAEKKTLTCIPDTLTATYGETLLELVPFGTATVTDEEETLVYGIWSWEDPAASVGDVGSHTFTAAFTPEDLTLYDVVTGIEVTVTVRAKTIPSNVTLDKESYPYTGSAIMPAVTVRDSKKELTEGTDYTVACENNTDAGTAKVTVTGKGNYTGSVSKKFAITKAASSISVESASIAVTKGGVCQINTATDPTDLPLTYASSREAVATVDENGLVTGVAVGNATITVSSGGDNNHNAAESKTVAVTVTNLAAQELTFPQEVQTVEYGTTGVAWTAYNASTGTTGAITYDSSNPEIAAVDAATGAVTINGIGETVITATAAEVSGAYAETSVTYTLTVKPKSIDPVVTVTPDTCTYTGSEIKPAVTVRTAADGDVIPASGYDVTYSSNTNAGTATVTVTCKGGNYTWTDPAAAPFTIEKAAAPAPLAVAENVSYDAATGTVPLPVPNVAGTLGDMSYTAAETADNDGILKDTPAVANGILTYTLADGLTDEAAGRTAVITVNVSSANYNDYTVTVTITLMNQSTQQTPAVDPGYNPRPGSTGGNTGKPSAPSAPATPAPDTGVAVSSSRTEVTTRPEASVSGSTAAVTVSEKMGRDLVDQAVESGSGTVTIAPVIPGGVDRAEVTIPATAAEGLAERTGAALKVETPAADVSIPRSALSDLAQRGGDVSVSVEKTGDVVSVELSVNGLSVSGVSGGVTVAVPQPGCTAGTVAMLIQSGGSTQVIRQSVADPVIGTVYVPLDGSAKVVLADNSKPFSDVPASDWASDAVAFVSSHELMSGDGSGGFDPNASMTRGMLAVVLHNLENNPSGSTSAVFDDVSGDWYAEAVQWAAGQQIVTGYDDGRFGPDDSISREQLAVMLYRYAGSPAVSGAALNFSDAGSVSDYAREAIAWAVSVGVMNGKGNGVLDPLGGATRAEVAQMLLNFVSAGIR